MRSGQSEMTSGSEQQPSLRDFLLERRADSPGLASVIQSIADASKRLARSIRGAGLSNILGSRGKVNVQGEVTQILDELATDCFVDALRGNEHVAGLACEELDDCEIFPGDGADRYLCVFDPIDGSSNIDVATSIGSIFGLYAIDGKEVTEASFLRTGRDQIAALYIVYGSSTQLVLATTEGVNIFTLHPAKDDFILTSPNVRIPAASPYYSVNEANAGAWDAAVQTAVAGFRKTCSLRYIGTLVADFHRGLLKGGIFLYPSDQHNPKGKLRLLYEANPLAFVAEAAGGAASSGTQRILDVAPASIHERVPLFIGNTDLVMEIENAQAKGAGLVTS
ncbi:MAG TPA: class 1 fructose-bisphosphatase [Dehalococcoidia bacterium]|nr:class 1 fructose-bisphosphatase [Dehalococcoidia bacterium]